MYEVILPIDLASIHVDYLKNDRHLEGLIGGWGCMLNFTIMSLPVYGYIYSTTHVIIM